MDNKPDWKSAIATCGDWTHELSLDKVLVSKDGLRMTVCFISGTLLNTKQTDALKKALRRIFPGVSVFMRVRYPGLKDKFYSDFESLKPFITEMVSEKSPGLKPFLNQAEFDVSIGELTLKLDAAAVDIMRQRDVPGMLTLLARELFDVETNVTLEARGRNEAVVVEMLELRKRREELFAFASPPGESSAPEKFGSAGSQVRDIEKTPVLRIERNGSKKAVYGKTIHSEQVPISDLREDSGKVTIAGDVVSVESRELSGGETFMVTFLLTDYTGTIQCKVFVRLKNKFERKKEENPAQRIEAIEKAVTEGAALKVCGECRYDTYSKDVTLIVSDINESKREERKDKSERKRVELHMHTQMSSMDGVSSAKSLIEQAAKWGHPAVAITDHGVVQAFPDAFAAAKKNGIRLIPGLEGYLIDDNDKIVTNPGGLDFSAPFVVFDVETTGLSPYNDRITEIGAVRFENGVETGTFSTLVNPGVPIPPKIVKLTGITDAMVRTAPKIEDVIAEFESFCDGAVLAAHNATFDVAFYRAALSTVGRKMDDTQSVLDTLALTRRLFPGIRKHKLGVLAQHLGVRLSKAHRAVNDARACMEILMRCIEMVKEKGATKLHHLNEFTESDAISSTSGSSYHIVLLAKTQHGLSNIYRLVSESHLNHFYRKPLLPRSVIIKYREGVIVGSACEAGEVYRAVLRGADDDELLRIASFYDYLEIQPIENNEFLVRSREVEDEEGLRNINRKILEIGDMLGKPVVAAGDVHFLHPQDETYRRVIMAGMGFEDADLQAPLYFKTTDEMLEEFSYLGDRAEEVVIDNPIKIAQSIDDISLFPKHPEGKETFQPIWPNAEDDIRRMSYENARSIYGDTLPDIVEKRLEKELGSIIGHGFASLYMIAHLLVKKSINDGYLVGSRGSVGSSFVATLINITEVNPLPSHYICPLCRYSNFDVDKERYPLGFDLPDAECPHCSTKMKKNGVDIPFEVFLGFYGDKVPDIDLNFSGVYQPKAHEYVETLFGKGYTFRAGTIGTLADKTAYGFVSKYFEKRNIEATKAEVDRLVKGCVGVKRTTGQHPGGMVVLPKGYEIYQFTPIQRPADDVDSNTMTTHFDFNSMHDTLVKLDILGHDDPTMLRMLEDLTQKKAVDVPLADVKVLSLFTSANALGVESDLIDKGTLGVPEFGTKFVRQMLEDTKPVTISELVRISGLSHGTDVWVSNAQDIIRSGTATLSQCICTRDDIMNYLISVGVPDKIAFDTMESVRKGKGLRPEMEKAMEEHNVPGWFVDSCKKIKYMFPKAHAVAYVTMALRIAYYKVYYPQAYYCAFFSVRGDAFDANALLGGADIVRARMETLLEKGKELTAKEGNLITLMEIVIEMNLRGILFTEVDLYTSHETLFEIVDGMIRPPLRALPGLGESAAASIVRARAEGRFMSVEDLRNRTKVSKTVIDILRESGCLAGVPETSQIAWDL